MSKYCSPPRLEYVKFKNKKIKNWMKESDSKLIRIMGRVFLNWESFQFEQKCQLFDKFMCTELNFFIFKKDFKFFE